MSAEFKESNERDMEGRNLEQHAENKGSSQTTQSSKYYSERVTEVLDKK